MAVTVKAIVFKTTRLKESKAFFENILKLPVKEYSAQHFVIHSKGVRIVFLESKVDFGVALYLSPDLNHNAQLQPVHTLNFKKGEDPNGISIIYA